MRYQPRDNNMIDDDIPDTLETETDSLKREVARLQQQLELLSAKHRKACEVLGVMKFAIDNL